MRFQALEFPVDPADPFANDAVGLQESANALTELLRNSSGPGVIAVDGEWGSGKTTFLAMWQAAYRQEGGAVVEYNAWKNDYCADVLVSLIQEMGDQLIIDAESDDGFKKLKQGTSQLLRDLLPLSVRLATSGLVNIEGMDAKTLGEGLGVLAEKKMQAYVASRDSLKGFKEKLQGFVQANVAENGKGLPVVVVVDELDRCRPDYSLKVLEHIKHLFDVDGLMFVLGVDLDQLAHAIAGVYGSNYDAGKYLSRFFDLKLALPPCKDTAGLIANFLTRLDAERLFPANQQNYLGNRKQLLDTLEEFVNVFELSKRTLSRVLVSLVGYLGSLPANGAVYPFFTACLAIIRQENRPIYARIASGKLKPEEIWSAISDRLSKDFVQSHPGCILHIETLLVSGGLEAVVAFSQNAPQTEHEKSLQRVAHHVQDLAQRITTAPLVSILRRLDLLGAVDRR